MLLDRLLQHRPAAFRPRRADAGRGQPERPAHGYDGRAATRLAHIPTGSATTARKSNQKDSGGMISNRNTWGRRTQGHYDEADEASGPNSGNDFGDNPVPGKGQKGSRGD